MRTYHSQPSRQAHWSHLQYVLFALISLSLVVITILLFVIAQMGPGSNGQYPTPVVVVSPTASPGPTFSPPPTSPPLSPTPPPPPGVLGYPLYSGNPELPEIALTFDDGPGPVYTAQILTILKQEGVRATFFVIGSNASRYPELVSQEVQQGHVVGNHTWSHSNLKNLSAAAVRKELQSTSSEIYADSGVYPVVFRPPGGNFNGSVQAIAASLGLSTVLWNVDPRDWSRPGRDAIIKTVLDTTHNGSIILLHDGGGDRSQTVAALPTIITTLAQRGFEFVTIPQMIRHLPPGGTGVNNITPDQLSPETSFTSCTAFHCPSLYYDETNADRKEVNFPALVV